MHSVDQISTDFEFEECETDRDFSVGTLRKTLNFGLMSFRLMSLFWKLFVRATIFHSFPCQTIIVFPTVVPHLLRNFFSDAIEELIRRGYVMELESMPEFCNPLHVAVQGNGKLRFIIDLSYLNKFVLKQIFFYYHIYVLKKIYMILR